MKTKFYGLTGGIGSGKSTVAHMFEAQNIPTLDLDKIGHNILQSDKIVQQKLIQTFGTHIQQQGVVNRKTLRDTAFNSKQNIKKLNAIMHPVIVTYEQQWRKRQTAPFAIIEASVLIESGGIQRMDGLIVVFTEVHIRKKRVLRRGKQSESQFETIIDKQCAEQTRKKYADYILDNNSDLQALAQQVQQLYAKLKLLSP